MALPAGKVGQGEILQVLKDKIIELMQAFEYDGTSDKIWQPWVNGWFKHNRLSVSWSEYPAVFVVVPRITEQYHSIARKKRWDITIQIEFYFDNYNEEDEEVCLEWVEQLSRMIRTKPLHPYAYQPSPDVFKVLDWVLDDTAIDYFIQDNHLLMGAVCSTTITIIDCRNVEGTS